MKKVLLALIAAGLLAFSSVGTMTAAGATLTVTPDPVPLGGTFTLAGCGYPTPTSISFEVVGPGVHYFTAGEPLTSPDGCFSEGWTAWWSQAGSYSITSWYRNTKGMTKKAAVVKFTVT